MLILSRRVNEEVVIDRRIRVRVLKARRGQVQLGIEAPSTVPVRRSELGDDRSNADRRMAPHPSRDID
jgi:carbon storage regulator